MFKFLKELKDSMKEGWEEGKAELAEEEAREEAVAQAAEAAARAEEQARIARIPPDEKFAAALAAPWRAVFFWDWYSVFKDDDSDADTFPLHLYTFGEPGLLTEKEKKDMRVNDLARDFDATDRESALRAAAEWLRNLSFAANRVVSDRLKDYESVLGESMDREETGANDPEKLNAEYRSAYGLTGVFCASCVANVLTSAVDVAYVEKALALEVLGDVAVYVREQCEDWEDYAAQFLAGEEDLGLNDKKGRKILEKFVGYLLKKPGSPWNNVPFESSGWPGRGSGDEETPPEVYSEQELDAIEAHIETHFGNYEKVFHEIVSPDIHVDICIVPPTDEHPWITLVTMGMGARRMNVPRKIRNRKLDRAELVVTLPPDWKLPEILPDGDLGDTPEEYYWPIRWLKILARLPIEQDSWLGYGHTVPTGGKPFAENTRLDCVMLGMPHPFGDASWVCVLPGGEEVNFYQMIPIHESELDFKKEHGAEAFEERWPEDFDLCVDVDREPFV